MSVQFSEYISTKNPKIAATRIILYRMRATMFLSASQLNVSIYVCKPKTLNIYFKTGFEKLPLYCSKLVRLALEKLQKLPVKFFLQLWMYISLSAGTVVIPLLK